MARKNLDGVAENAAAIAIAMADEGAEWADTLYSVGYLEMTDSIVRAAQALEDARRRKGGEWGEDYEWESTVSALAKGLLKRLALMSPGTAAGAGDLADLAERSLVRF